LPDTQTTAARPRADPAPSPSVRTSSVDLKAPGPPLPEGEGKEVVAKMCTRCHGTTVFAKMRMSRIGWEDEVVSMIEKGATGTEDEIRIVVDYMVKHFGAL
jgi:cytochrome c5